MFSHALFFCNTTFLVIWELHSFSSKELQISPHTIGHNILTQCNLKLVGISWYCPLIERQCLQCLTFTTLFFSFLLFHLFSARVSISLALLPKGVCNDPQQVPMLSLLKVSCHTIHSICDSFKNITYFHLFQIVSVIPR